MTKVKINKSIEGSIAQEVIIEKELFEALHDNNTMDSTFNDLLVNMNYMPVELIEKFSARREKNSEVFRKFGLDKYDIRANWDFHNSQLV